MIIEALLNVLYNVFSVLTSPINIPSMPEGVASAMNKAITYISNGVGILHNYVDVNYLFTLFLLILGMDAAVRIYYFVMWLVKKIPMLNVH